MTDVGKCRALLIFFLFCAIGRSSKVNYPDIVFAPLVTRKCCGVCKNRKTNWHLQRVVVITAWPLAFATRGKVPDAFGVAMANYALYNTKLHS